MVTVIIFYFPVCRSGGEALKEGDGILVRISQLAGVSLDSIDLCTLHVRDQPIASAVTGLRRRREVIDRPNPTAHVKLVSDSLEKK